MLSAPLQSHPASLLLATDLSARCDRALARAVALARQWQARLVVLCVLPGPVQQELLGLEGHGDAQFAGSSSVPAHVDMMGLIGAGNNPMVGMTVAVAVAVQEAMSK